MPQTLLIEAGAIPVALGTLADRRDEPAVAEQLLVRPRYGRENGSYRRRMGPATFVVPTILASPARSLSLRLCCPKACPRSAPRHPQALLTALALRNPATAAALAAAGAVESALEAMTDHAASSGAQRQACMLIRNIVARSPELRPPALAAGAEAALRAAKARHPVQCGDVGSAALRDLGLENYLE